jgi:hypothetical protein
VVYCYLAAGRDSRSTFYAEWSQFTDPAASSESSSDAPSWLSTVTKRNFSPRHPEILASRQYFRKTSSESRGQHSRWSAWRRDHTLTRIGRFRALRCNIRYSSRAGCTTSDFYSVIECATRDMLGTVPSGWQIATRAAREANKAVTMP